MQIFKNVWFWVIFAFAALAVTALGFGLGFGLKKPDRRKEEGERDTQQPVVTIEHVGELVAVASVRIEYTATDDVGVTRVEIVVTNGAGEDVTDEVYDRESSTFTATEAGKYTFTVKAYDEAGNFGSAMHVISVREPEAPPAPVDTTRPTVIFSGENTVYVGDVLDLPFTATDDVAVVHVEVQITDPAGIDVTAEIYDEESGTFTPTEEGEFTVIVRAFDAAGNCGSAELVVTASARPVESVSDYELPQNPNYGVGVSVHDPSVYYDEATQKFYVFGSHFAVASSTDLIHWEQIAYDGQAQKLYGTSAFRTVLSKSDQIVGGDQNTWAPAVRKIGDKYYMYYSLTSTFGSNKSVIGRVSSDSVTGPYSNEEIIVWSEGLSGNPNCIDPELFSDKEGKLWMVYGSFFGGVYIKELNAQTGLPVQSGVHDYGKLLWKCGSTGVEGPFVFYSEETDYYYLMVSDGDLSTDYNMRVARSKNPDGPYTDGAGRNMAVSYGGGNKLAGNYRFAEDGVGYAAMGHNSVVKSNGKYFAVYHTRYRDGDGNAVTGGHNVQVRQLFFNADGWIVMAPNRYAGETLGKVVGSDFAGNYDVVLHSEGNDRTFVSSSRYQFLPDGTIVRKKATVGSWTIAGDQFVEITLNSVTYKGVIAPAWVSYEGAALSFTAMSAEGRSLWGNRTESDVAAVGGITVLQELAGDASNRRMDAFNTSNGFSVSFFLSEAIAERNDGASVSNDWNSAAVTAGAYAIHLPNLDAYTSTGELAGMNRYPLENLSVWNTFLNTTCYVTITVSKTGGITYYKNGAKVLTYDPNYAMHKNDGDTWTSSVGKFIELLLSEIEKNGFTFAGGIKAEDLILSEAVTDEQAAALYQDYIE